MDGHWAFARISLNLPTSRRAHIHRRRFTHAVRCAAEPAAILWIGAAAAVRVFLG
jgi:hypothetical protein